MKDANSFTKNVLYFHSNSSKPLLCLSLVLVTSDNHDEGHALGSDKEWVIKDIAGVLLTMELECFVAVLGLAYELPYLPEDNVHREKDLSHFSMVDNAFSFTMGMMHKTGEHILDIVYYGDAYFTKDFEKAKASSSSKSTLKGINKFRIFAPASPALSSKVAGLSSVVRRPSLRASDTGMDIV